MTGWTKQLSGNTTGVTEFPAGPGIMDLAQRFGGTGRVILCLDVSYSMKGERIKSAQAGCWQFIQEATAASYEVGMILWHHRIAGSVAPQKSPDAVLALLDRAEDHMGGTDVVPALELAHKMHLANPADDMVVAVFGDGDLGDKAGAVRNADLMAADGIRIITSGVDGSEQRLAVINRGDTGSQTAPQEAPAQSAEQSIATMATGLRQRKKNR